MDVPSAPLRGGVWRHAELSRSVDRVVNQELSLVTQPLASSQQFRKDAPPSHQSIIHFIFPHGKENSLVWVAGHSCQAPVCQFVEAFIAAS